MDMCKYTHIDVKEVMKFFSTMSVNTLQSRRIGLANNKCAPMCKALAPAFLSYTDWSCATIYISLYI